MSGNRDSLPDEPLSDAERARRYRARLRGEDVPLGQPGRRPAPDPTDAEVALRAAQALSNTLWRLKPEDVDPLLPVLLEGIVKMAGPFLPHHD
jgi:hypothetical protein